ncbi:2OG-Fe dioxygenase family protein [Pseudomonas sp. SDO55104_S430]
MNNLPVWASGELSELKARYLRDRYLFIEGEKLKEYLRCLGATDVDIISLQYISDNLRSDPTLPFRKSRNGRFLFDYKESNITRLEFQPFILSHDEDFVRFDSNKLRSFEEIDNELQLNTAFQALLCIKSMFIKDFYIHPRKNLLPERHRNVCTVFNLRTLTTRSLQGEPALEGVHSDGVEHTMTTLLGTKNMSLDSAVTFIHDYKEENGIGWDSASEKYMLGRVQHMNFLDTLFIVDSEKKHSLSPVYASDTNKEATRDMLIFFTRRPTSLLHSTNPFDSLNAHRDLPMHIELPRTL